MAASPSSASVLAPPAVENPVIRGPNTVETVTSRLLLASRTSLSMASIVVSPVRSARGYQAHDGLRLLAAGSLTEGHCDESAVAESHVDRRPGSEAA